MPTLRAGNTDVVISEGLACLFLEWEDLAEEVIGRPRIPIEVRTRYEFPEFSQFMGELNVAQPKMRRSDGRVVLAVILESVTPLNEITAAHEVMHWILKLQGFPSLQNQDDPNSDITVLLNSLIAHVPLNRLMAERGFDYLSMEDFRSRDAMQSIQEKGLPESPSEEEVTWLTLYYGDLILSSSPSVSDQLRQALKPWPIVSARVRKTLSTLEHYNLHIPEQSRKAAMRLVKTLRLSRWGTFVAADNVGELRRAVERLSAR